MPPYDQPWQLDYGRGDDSPASRTKIAIQVAVGFVGGLFCLVPNCLIGALVASTIGGEALGCTVLTLLYLGMTVAIGSHVARRIRRGWPLLQDGRREPRRFYCIGFAIGSGTTCLLAFLYSLAAVVLGLTGR